MVASRNCMGCSLVRARPRDSAARFGKRPAKTRVDVGRIWCIAKRTSHSSGLLQPVRIDDPAPNILLQMLLRGANGVGYTNYPDNVVRHFVAQAKRGGVDLFRVFDCLNWVENKRLAIDAVRNEGGVCKAALCYTGDIVSSARQNYRPI